MPKSAESIRMEVLEGAVDHETPVQTPLLKRKVEEAILGASSRIECSRMVKFIADRAMSLWVINQANSAEPLQGALLQELKEAHDTLKEAKESLKKLVQNSEENKDTIMWAKASVEEADLEVKSLEPISFEEHFRWFFELIDKCNSKYSSEPIKIDLTAKIYLSADDEESDQSSALQETLLLNALSLMPPEQIKALLAHSVMGSGECGLAEAWAIATRKDLDEDSQAELQALFKELGGNLCIAAGSSKDTVLTKAVAVGNKEGLRLLLKDVGDNNVFRDRDYNLQLMSSAVDKIVEYALRPEGEDALDCLAQLTRCAVDKGMWDELSSAISACLYPAAIGNTNILYIDKVCAQRALKTMIMEYPEDKLPALWNTLYSKIYLETTIVKHDCQQVLGALRLILKSGNPKYMEGFLNCVKDKGKGLHTLKEAVKEQPSSGEVDIGGAFAQGEHHNEVEARRKVKEDSENTIQLIEYFAAHGAIKPAEPVIFGGPGGGGAAASQKKKKRPESGYNSSSPSPPPTPKNSPP